MATENPEVGGKPVIWCPMGKERWCLAAMGLREKPGCAWWIPGAECCAIVYLARKLGDLAATAWIEVERKEPTIPALPF